MLSAIGNRVSLVIPPCQRSRYATYFDVAVLRCLLQPHWSEEGTQWSLMYYLQRLRHMLEVKKVVVSWGSKKYQKLVGVRLQFGSGDGVGVG